MGNSLVESKKAGEEHLEVLLAGELSISELENLHDIAVELTNNGITLETTLLGIRVEQARLLNEAYVILGKDNMAFSAWVNLPENEIPFQHQKAFEIMQLGHFCKNKNVQKLNLSSHAVAVLASPKWSNRIMKKDDKTIVESEDKEKKKAVNAAYRKLGTLKLVKQTGAKAKELVEAALIEAGLSLPATKTPPKWKVGQAEDAADRLLVKIFQSFEGMPEIKYLKQHILKEMQEW